MGYQVILISGKQGSGKTTLSSAITEKLQEESALRVYELSFASVIYEMHDAVRNIGYNYGIPLKEPKDGPLLQLLGTEWGRNTISEDVWVKAAQAKVLKILERYELAPAMPIFIFGDTRFENELAAFPEALKVRLECEKDRRKHRVSMWRDKDDHPSEVSLDKAHETGKFDLELNTGILSPEICAERVLERLSV